MCELEDENPRLMQYIKGFKVRHSSSNLTRFYALQAFEDNGGPIDYLIGKKQATALIKTISTVAKQNFQKC